MLAVLLGLGLRIYLLPDQVFADDEWHGFYYALGKSPWWLLTHFSIPGATCIPLNLYNWLLGATIGWSEIWLRMPSLVCGLLLIGTGPLLARRIIGDRATVLLAFLLALSPTLTFYSRFARPYSALALFGFWALLFAARWIQSGKSQPAVLFVLTSVAAIYFHLFALVTVAAPLLAALVIILWQRMSGSEKPSMKQWFWAIAATAMLSALLVLPALVDSIRSTFFTIALKGTFKLEALPKLAMLISGTGQPVLAISFWLALLLGAREMCRKHAAVGWMLISLYPLHALGLILMRPDCTQSAVLLLRYCIPVLPATLLLVACGVHAAMQWLGSKANLRPALQVGLMTAWIVALGLTGPLPRTYLRPNNFTNHGAYQHSYQPNDWTHSFYSDFTPANFTLVTVIRADEISPFYTQLAGEISPRPVLEYPMMIGDHFNPLYYYQRFHHRPVLVGYRTNIALPKGLAAGNIFGSTYVDQVLSVAPDPTKLHFRNLISLEEPQAIRERNVEYVILHKRFEAQLSAVASPVPRWDELVANYRQAFGNPCYEDDAIIVFRP